MNAVETTALKQCRSGMRQRAAAVGIINLKYTEEFGFIGVKKMSPSNNTFHTLHTCYIFIAMDEIQKYWLNTVHQL